MHYVTFLIMIFTNVDKFSLVVKQQRPSFDLCAKIISGGQLANLAKFLRHILGKVQTCFLKEVICYLIFM